MKWPIIEYAQSEKGRYVKRCYLTVEQKRALLKKGYEIYKEVRYGKKESDILAK